MLAEQQIGNVHLPIVNEQLDRLCILCRLFYSPQTHLSPIFSIYTGGVLKYDPYNSRLRDDAPAP